MFKPQTALYVFVVTASLAVSACQPAEGPAERAGKAIDQTAEKIGDQVDKAADKVHDTAKEAERNARK